MIHIHTFNQTMKTQIIFKRRRFIVLFLIKYVLNFFSTFCEFYHITLSYPLNITTFKFCILFEIFCLFGFDEFITTVIWFFLIIFIFNYYLLCFSYYAYIVFHDFKYRVLDFLSRFYSIAFFSTNGHSTVLYRPENLQN